MDRFAKYHPLVNFLYFTLVIGFSMALNHPLAQGISFVCAATYAVQAEGKKAVLFTLRWCLPIMLLTAFMNPAFSHEGITILLYFPTGNPLTLESILYGLSAGVMIATVMLWFLNFNRVMTSDMAMQPGVLVLDEPTAQLDPIAAADFLALLGKINRELGTTIILTEHRLEEAFPFATRVIVMNEGTMICDNKPENVGLQLKDKGSGMFLAMPTAMRVWAAVETKLSCPMTVRDGSKFLSQRAEEQALLPLAEKAPPVYPEDVTLECDDLWFRYEKDSPDVVKGFSLKLRKGEFYAILGGNGAGNQHYNVTAILVLIECMVPFFLVFESRKPKARELVTIAVLCAIGIAGRSAFFMLPQFKPVLALVIISGVAFGGETGFLVGAVTMMVSNILFSQGPWMPWQMFSMGIIGFLAGVLFRKGLLRRSRGSLATFGAFAAVIIYGGIMNPAAALMYNSQTINWEMLKAYYVSGLPMDLIHAAATAVFILIAAEPMLEKLDRIKVKYGLVE